MIGSLDTFFSHISPGPAPLTRTSGSLPWARVSEHAADSILDSNMRATKDDITYSTSVVFCFHNWLRFLWLISNRFNLDPEVLSSWRLCLYNMCGVFFPVSSQVFVYLNKWQCIWNIPVAWRPPAWSIHDCSWWLLLVDCVMAISIYGNVCFWDLVSRCAGIIDLTCGW